jgi:hypothetical protein
MRKHKGGERKQTHDTRFISWYRLTPGLTEQVGTGPTGPDRFRFRPVPNQYKFKIWIWIQKMKKSHKILKNTSRCVEYNGVKNFQIFVRLV